MEHHGNLKTSSGERKDTSKMTGDKSDDVMEIMLKSVVDGRRTLFELNEKFENLDRYDRDTTEMVESKTFSESQNKIEATYSEKMEDMKIEIMAQLDKQGSFKETIKTLEDALETKESEINELKETIEELQHTTRTIKELEMSQTNLQNQVRNMKSAYKQIEEKYKDACTEQKQAQSKCEYLEAEKIILEKSFKTEKEMSGKLASIRTVQSSFGEPNKAEFNTKIETIANMYDENLKKWKRSYENQLKQLKRNMESERVQLKLQIEEQYSEFQELKNEQIELEKEILRYKRLLITKMKSYSTEEQKEGTGDETVKNTTQDIPEGSAV